MARNIVHMALPMTVAQLINILYNVVDRMYLGRLPGHLALTGLGLCLPIISILMAFANLCGMGGAPLCSIHRGRGENEEAERIMGNSFALLLLFGAGLTVLCLAFRRPILYLFGASDVTFPYANDYLTIYVLGTVFVMIGLGMNPFINSQGFSGMGMLTVALGAVVNIVLDPIFIFTFDMGVTGAALATITAQGVSAVWVVCFLMGRRTRLRLQRRFARLNWKVLAPVLALGVSPFIMQSTESLVNIAFNASLKTYGGDPAVGAMTICSSIMQVFYLLFQGIGQGAQPIIGYNYGSGQLDRVRKAFRLTFLWAFAFSTAVCAAIELFPLHFVTIFNDEPALVGIAVWTLRVYAAGMFMLGIQNACQQTFVALGQAKISLFLALLRKVILLLPLILILPRLITGHQVMAVFLAEPVADVLAALTTGSMFLWRFPRILARRQKELDAKHA